ncbi:MAG: LURP-one-related family protein [Lachnospiraceae bacterium]|nr:LURP-one-related family protein [Lachnospiraceae bacterium]
MKFYIKQKVFSWADRFNVTDENGETRYSVKGELISIGKQLHIYDNADREVAFIQQKVLSFKPRFFVFVNGEQIAEIVKEFTLFRPKYSILGKGWVVNGDFWDHDYVITEEGNTVASVHKVWMSWGDSYELNLVDTNDEVGLLAVILAIDAVMDAQESR